MPATKPIILIVIDGLTPSMFEAAVGDRRAPALSFLAEHGEYRRAACRTLAATANAPINGAETACTQSSPTTSRRKSP